MSAGAIDTLVIAVVQDEDADVLLAGLREAAIGVTKIGSNGGFLRIGNSTFLIGIPAARLGQVRGIIRQHCRRRLQPAMPFSATMDPGLLVFPEQLEVEVGGAIVFIRSLDRFVQV